MAALLLSPPPEPMPEGANPQCHCERSEAISFYAMKLKDLLKLILEALIPYAVVLFCIITMVLLVAYAQWVDWTVKP